MEVNSIQLKAQYTTSVGDPTPDDQAKALLNQMLATIQSIKDLQGDQRAQETLFNNLTAQFNQLKQIQGIQTQVFDPGWFEGFMGTGLSVLQLQIQSFPDQVPPACDTATGFVNNFLANIK